MEMMMPQLGGSLVSQRERRITRRVRLDAWYFCVQPTRSRPTADLNGYGFAATLYD
jgi:hypothetical protein